MAANVKYCDEACVTADNETSVFSVFTGVVGVLQPNKTADKIAIEINLVEFSLFNTGLHSGKMLSLV
ncbi:hypothetical protein swp_2082 [Shewanella piezotolerans WP3]|uniref:Uncharacterized protein n=1 Tax=Shewanella piezotolerans (strain WP3 / JCM 13877) TaxID=225849 RepID=B8CNK3_SHEPW|nr:hypothetical protein swp_2082 [Shewanella piezotolerans WP3]